MVDNKKHLLSDEEEWQIVPRRVAHSGSLVLHAALLEREGCAIALAGPSGIGKSTLSAALWHLGWRILGDDTMVVSLEGGRAMACALFPRLRLKPDSARIIQADSLEDGGVDSLGKHVFHVERDETPLHLNAMFALDVAAGGKVEAIRMTGPDACMTVVANSFALDATDRLEAARRFGEAADVADILPLFRLRYPRDFEIVASVNEAISSAIGYQRAGNSSRGSDDRH